MRRLFLVGIFLFDILFFSGCVGPSDSNNSYISKLTNPKLTLTITGIGKGKIHSSQGEINCSKAGGACSTITHKGEKLTLTAEPENGYLFLGWYGGICHGGLDCEVTMDQAKEIKAAFGMVAYISNLNPFPNSMKNSNRSLSDIEASQIFNIWIATTDGKTSYPLTQLGRANSQFPRWSPDGTKLLYQSSRALDGSDQDIGRSNIWVVNADGSNHKPLTSLTQADSFLPQWSPDGKQIVYGSFQALDGTDYKSDFSNIWMMNSDGSNPKPLTKLTKGGSYEPQWSPDGKQIVYESARALDGNDSTNEHYNIWIMNADGSSPKPLTQLTKADSYLPQWSPDGSKIAYQSFQALDGKDHKNDFSNIWVVNSDGSNPKPITQLTKAGSYSAQWSSDSTHLLYESSRALDGTDNTNEHYNIWIADLNDPNHKPLTHFTQADSYVPQGSADGSQLIYGSSATLDGADQNNNHLSNIWVMNLDQLETKPLTQSNNAHSFLQFIAE